MSIFDHPAPGTYSLAGFGPRKPIPTPSGMSSAFHRGRDFSLHGQTFRVLAARSGTIRWAYRSELGGLEVLIEHGPVDGFTYLASRYGHLASFGPGIRAGAPVHTGQLIGMAGATGRADGVHLHFEVFTDPALGLTQRDPDPFLPSTPDPEDDIMATLSPEAIEGLEHFGRNAKSYDLARWQVGDLHGRRGILDQLALDRGRDTGASPADIAAEVVEALGTEVAANLAGAILDAVRTLEPAPAAPEGAA